MDLKYRIKMAWWILTGRESFDIYTEGYHPMYDLKPGHNCDFCHDNEAKKCYTRTLASFRLIREDHRHLCDTCGEKITDKLASERDLF